MVTDGAKILNMSFKTLWNQTTKLPQKTNTINFKKEKKTLSHGGNKKHLN